MLLLVFVATSLQAQHSDLYSYIKNTVKPTHFSESNAITYSNVMGLPGIREDDQPVLVIDDVIRRKSDSEWFTQYTDLDAYTMSQIHAVYVWRKKGDVKQLGYTSRGLLGVIFVYTKAYTFPNPQKPNIPRSLAGNNNPNKRVVFEAPLPPPLPPNRK